MITVTLSTLTHAFKSVISNNTLVSAFYFYILLFGFYGVTRAQNTATTTTQSSGSNGKNDNGDDDSVSWKIAVGISVPVVLLLIAGVAVYYLYRKKFPVRMILGREFTKTRNPNYDRPRSTATLVREDADDFFKSTTSSQVNLNLDEYNPVNSAVHYARENLAYQHDDDDDGDDIDARRRGSGGDMDDEDPEDREFRKKKSWLFKSAAPDSDDDDGDNNGNDANKSNVKENGDNIEIVDETKSSKGRGESSGEKMESTEDDSDVEAMLSAQTATPIPTRKQQKNYDSDADDDESQSEVSQYSRDQNDVIKNGSDDVFRKNNEEIMATNRTNVDVKTERSKSLIDPPCRQQEYQRQNSSSKPRSLSVDLQKSVRGISITSLEDMDHFDNQPVRPVSMPDTKQPFIIASVVGHVYQRGDGSFYSSASSLSTRYKEHGASFSSLNSNPHLVTDLDDTDTDSVGSHPTEKRSLEATVQMTLDKDDNESSRLGSNRNSDASGEHNGAKTLHQTNQTTIENVKQTSISNEGINKDVQSDSTPQNLSTVENDPDKEIKVTEYDVGDMDEYDLIEEKIMAMSSTKLPMMDDKDGKTFIVTANNEQQTFDENERPIGRNNTGGANTEEREGNNSENLVVNVEKREFENAGSILAAFSNVESFFESGSNDAIENVSSKLESESQNENKSYIKQELYVERKENEEDNIDEQTHERRKDATEEESNLEQLEQQEKHKVDNYSDDNKNNDGDENDVDKLKSEEHQNNDGDDGDASSSRSSSLDSDSWATSSDENRDSYAFNLNENDNNEDTKIITTSAKPDKKVVISTPDNFDDSSSTDSLGSHQIETILSSSNQNQQTQSGPLKADESTAEKLEDIVFESDKQNTTKEEINESADLDPNLSYGATLQTDMDIKNEDDNNTTKRNVHDLMSEALHEAQMDVNSDLDLDSSRQTQMGLSSGIIIGDKHSTKKSVTFDMKKEGDDDQSNSSSSMSSPAELVDLDDVSISDFEEVSSDTGIEANKTSPSRTDTDNTSAKKKITITSTVAKGSNSSSESDEGETITSSGATLLELSPSMSQSLSKSDHRDIGDLLESTNSQLLESSEPALALSNTSQSAPSNIQVKTKILPQLQFSDDSSDTSDDHLDAINIDQRSNAPSEPNIDNDNDIITASSDHNITQTDNYQEDEHDDEGSRRFSLGDIDAALTSSDNQPIIMAATSSTDSANQNLSFDLLEVGEHADDLSFNFDVKKKITIGNDDDEDDDIDV